MTGCEEAGCGTDHGVCGEADNECDIQCGADQYRHGDYCYHCSRMSESTPCRECDGEGLCAVCNAGYGERRGECRAMEQVGLDRIAGELEAAGRAGCTSPDLLTCREETCQGSGECGTFGVVRDGTTMAVNGLFVFIISMLLL